MIYALQTISFPVRRFPAAGCCPDRCGAASSTASSAAGSEAASSVASSAAASETAAAALPDGVYTADFDTDSGMFHANEACDGKGTLTVENGTMTFHVSLASRRSSTCMSAWPQTPTPTKPTGCCPPPTPSPTRRHLRRGLRLRHPRRRRRRGLPAGSSGHQGQVVRPHRQHPQRGTQGGSGC